MIPKIIHYCWFGGKPLPELTLKCIDSWKKHLPEYKIIEWNESNFDVNKYQFTKEAYSDQKHAFVADVCRLEVLNEFGGIYFDTDMELIKPINNLKNFLVLGFEDINFVAAGIIICDKNNSFVQKILDFYSKESFASNINKLKGLTIPKLITDELIKKGLILNNTFQTLEDNIEIYPSDYFYPLNYFTGKTIKTDNTVAIHHYDSSWMTEKEKNLNKTKVFLIRIFGEKIIFSLIRFFKKQ